MLTPTPQNVRLLAVVPGVKASAASASEGTPEHRCLVRAVSGKTKFSAELTDRNYQKFMQSYGNILKVSLDSLKKREKKKSDISRGQSTRLIVKKASDKKATR